MLYHSTHFVYLFIDSFDEKVEAMTFNNEILAPLYASLHHEKSLFTSCLHSKSDLERPLHQVLPQVFVGFSPG